jgi:hypothetical protein
LQIRRQAAYVAHIKFCRHCHSMHHEWHDCY